MAMLVVLGRASSSSSLRAKTGIHLLLPHMLIPWSARHRIARARSAMIFILHVLDFLDVVVVLRFVLCFTGATGALSLVFALFAGRVSSSSSKARRALLLRVCRCEEDIPKACTAGRVMTSSMESMFIVRSMLI